MDDLLEVEILEQRKKLGLGELTTIAFAKTTRQATFSDDTKARRLSAEVLGNEYSQTTCHLFGWLFFVGILGDSDCNRIINEHKKFDGKLEPHLRNAYGLAMNARLYKDHG